MSSWLLEEVAEAQLAAVQKELRHPLLCGPYRQFIQVLGTIYADAQSILDIGCGVGGYSVLCAREFPNLRYTGTDISPHMIRRAQGLCSTGCFEVCEFYANSLDYDIILASAVIEYAGALQGLGFLLDGFKKYLILHRIRITDGPSCPIDEPTYCGHTERFFTWNLYELRQAINGKAHIGQECLWDTQSTFIIVH